VVVVVVEVVVVVVVEVVVVVAEVVVKVVEVVVVVVMGDDVMIWRMSGRERAHVQPLALEASQTVESNSLRGGGCWSHKTETQWKYETEMQWK
jgi:hypothetical protein